MKKQSLLVELQQFGGTIIGLIMLAIGAVIFLHAFINLYVFQYTTSSYFSAEQECYYEDFTTQEFPSFINEPIEISHVSSQKTERSEEEKTICIKDKTHREEIRYIRNEQENLVSGLITLIIGFPLWFFHRQRKKK